MNVEKKIQVPKVTVKRVSKSDKQPEESPLFSHIDESKPLDKSGFPHVLKRENGSHKLKDTIQNHQHMYDQYQIQYKTDIVSKEMIVRIPGFTEGTLNENNTKVAYLQSLAVLNGLSPHNTYDYLCALADVNPYNPIANWITSTPWDGVDRLQDFYITFTTTEGYPIELKETLLLKWLTSIDAANTMPEGFHSRGVLTLQGGQGMGKTTAIRNVFPSGILRDKYILTGHHLDPSSKDSVMTAIKHAIVEIGELDSSFKKDVARLKGFITLDRDTVRRPYGRTNSEFPRRTVFAASVNETNFLVDPTGNSRFWVLPCTHIDYDHDIDMQQVFAQVHEGRKNGNNWWLTPDEEKLLADWNDNHNSVSAIEELLLEKWDFDLPEDKRKMMSATEQLQCIGIKQPTNPQTRECGQFSRKHFGEPRKTGGAMKWLVPIHIDIHRV